MHIAIFLFLHSTATSWTTNSSISLYNMPRPVVQSPNVTKTAVHQDLGQWAKSVIAAKNAKSPSKPKTDPLSGVTDHMKALPDLIFEHKEPKLEPWMVHPRALGELVLHEWMPLPSAGTHPLSMQPARPQDPIKDPARRPHPIHNPGAWLNSSFCGWPEGAVLEGPKEITDLIKPIIPPSTSSVTELRWRTPK